MNKPAKNTVTSREPAQLKSGITIHNGTFNTLYLVNNVGNIVVFKHLKIV